MQYLRASKKIYSGDAMNGLDGLKKFVFNGILLDDSLERLEGDGISARGLGSKIAPVRVDEADFSPRVVFKAKTMSGVFEAFFCLENSVRELIEERLKDRRGLEWWKDCVGDKIRGKVEALKEKEEKNRYHTSRSENQIGYTLFGDLAKIIVANWDNFSDLFPSQQWITSRFDDLEMSRNIIMHTGVLPDIEIERIESIIRDWIRQVG
jgi:hypothetical protein